ncbi:hypothetical protein Tco_1252716 [Tanacetum coccineum]
MHMGDVRAQNQDLLITISEKGLKDVTNVRRPSSRSSSSKNSVLSNAKNYSEDVEVHVRTNKKTNVTSKKNVFQPKKIVTNVDVKNALKAKDVLCVSCDNNVLTLCYDTCLVKHKLSVNSKVIRSLFTTPRIAKSKSLDTTFVVAKTRFAVVTPLSAKYVESSALRSTSLFAQEISLRKYMRTNINTSKKWKKWYDTQPNVGWTPKSLTANVYLSVVKGRIRPISLYLVYKDDEYNYNYCMMYKNQRYDLDNAMENRNKLLVVVSKDIEAIYNVIEDEPHFITKALEAEDVVAKVEVTVVMVGEEVPWPEEVEIQRMRMGKKEGLRKLAQRDPSLWLGVKSVLKVELVPVEEKSKMRHLELMEESSDSQLEVIVFGMEEMLDEGILSLLVFLEGDGSVWNFMSIYRAKIWKS